MCSCHTRTRRKWSEDEGLVRRPRPVSISPGLGDQLRYTGLSDLVMYHYYALGRMETITWANPQTQLEVRLRLVDGFESDLPTS